MSNDDLTQRLTPFEHYMLADDRAAHPMNFFLRFGFQGSLCRSRLEQTLIESLLVCPLLTSTVKRERGRWLWDYARVAPRLAEHAIGTSLSAWPGCGIQLARESGLRVSLAVGEGASELWLQVHHSCADAIGILGFIADWFRRYESSGDDEHAVARGHEQRGIEELSQRLVRPKLPRWRYLAPSRHELRRLVGFAANRPWPILVRGTPRSAPAGFPAFVSHRLPFSRDIWRELKSRLPIPASFNDVFLRLVFRVICHWNDEFAGSPSRYCIRIAMPTDLRPATGQPSIAMNNVSMVFMDRTSSAIRSGNLLHDIHGETDWIKRNHGAFVLHDVLRILQPVPGGIESLVAPTNCTTTMVVSNLGHLSASLQHDRVLQLGEAQLTEVDFLAPIRRGTLAALGVVTYLDQLHICMHYDAQRMARMAAEDLLCRIM
jgi:hypothetical protein